MKNTTTPPGLPRPTAQRFALYLALLTIFAWLLREYFIAVTVVEAPIRGDIRQYVAYAWNLLHHGTFSHLWPGTGVPTPDKFRGPGYPVFLAGTMALSDSHWYQLALHIQALLGALTAALTVLLGRHWLATCWAFVAGVLMAIWPHHVAATGAMLTEVLFGFFLTLALLLAAEALKRREVAWAASSGVVFSMAALTNPISLFFPLLVAVVFKGEQLPKAALVLLGLAFIGPATWSVRGALIDQPLGQPDRITMNLVQGAWPQYHRAYASQRSNMISRDIMRTIDAEIELVASSPAKGLDRVADRLASDPMYYGQWYLLQKPYQLWAWDVQVGAGDVYFHRVAHSPLETHPVLNFTKRTLEKSNVAIFVLSLMASIALLIGWLRKDPRIYPAGVMGAGFVAYVTVVHMVFQAESRYSIPYRPIELLMFASAAAFGWEKLRNRALGPGAKTIA